MSLQESIVPVGPERPRLISSSAKFWSDRSVWKGHAAGALLTIVVIVGFGFVLSSFFVPAIGMPGVDENAYLVGGRNLVTHFSPGLHPQTPFAFIGPMWDLGRSGWFYPKYPFGVPLLNACAIWLSPGHDVRAAFVISPVCAALSIAAIFVLARLVVSEFWAVIAAILLACNPTLLQLALVPSSHAPDICFALWGMTALVAFMRGGRPWLGIVAGLLLGFAVTIRYSEGLLLLPLAISILLRVRWKRWQSWAWNMLPFAAWLIPVGTLFIFNHATTGHWTGYDSTNESTGFTVAEFLAKWQSTLEAMDFGGLSLLLPVGILGMLMMLAQQWKLGLIFLGWFVPTALLYMAYYWGGAGQGVSYLRFFLAIYPPIIVAAVWMMSEIARKWQGLVAAGAFVAAVSGLGVFNTLPSLAQTQASNLPMAYSGQALLESIAHTSQRSDDPIFFTDQQAGGMGSQLLLYMQFIGGGDWYTGSSFTTRGDIGPGGPGGGGPGFGGPRLGNANNVNNANNPTIVDPQRREYLQNQYAGLSDYDLKARERQIVDQALDQGRGVYALLSDDTVSDFADLMESEGFRCKTLASWSEPRIEIPASARTGAAMPGGGGIGAPGMGRGPLGGRGMPGFAGGAGGPGIGAGPGFAGGPPGGPMFGGPGMGGGPGGFNIGGPGGADQNAVDREHLVLVQVVKI